jgi:hypothetical protein
MFQVCSSSIRGPKLPASCLIFCILFACYASAQTPQIVLGSSQLMSSVDHNDSGLAEAFPVTANITGQINSLWVFLDSSNASKTVWVGIYSNGFNHPRSLLAQGNIANPAGGRWNSATIPGMNVKQGKTYWIALLGVGGQIGFHDGAGACQSETSRVNNLNSLPSNWWPGQRWSSCLVSEFAAGAASSVGTLTISPASASLRIGQQLQFSAAGSGTTAGVVWSASGGSVTSSGLYTAPSSPGTYTITVKSAADATVSASAQVTITSPTVVSVSVTPNSASVAANSQQQFTAMVSGTSNTAVTWTASGGTVSTAGVYTAPNLPGTYSVKAASVADPTKSGSASVTVSTAPTVSISISPTTVSMPQKWTEQFTSVVSGTSNQGVTWSVAQGTGTVGTNGLFTAPSSVETDRVTVTSLVDSTKTATAVINIVPPHTVSLTWGASTSSNVSSYNVYRGTTSGGPYSVLQSGLLTTFFTDANVQPGAVYYYVTTAVDTSQAESSHSNEVQAVIPTP